jgi:hypothetical protein
MSSVLGEMELRIYLFIIICSFHTPQLNKQQTATISKENYTERPAVTAGFYKLVTPINISIPLSVLRATCATLTLGLVYDLIRTEGNQI